MLPFLYCTAFILPGSLARDLSWLFLLCLQNLLSSQLLRAFCTCAYPLAALAVASAYAKYTFGKIFF